MFTNCVNNTSVIITNQSFKMGLIGYFIKGIFANIEENKTIKCFALINTNLIILEE